MRKINIMSCLMACILFFSLSIVIEACGSDSEENEKSMVTGSYSVTGSIREDKRIMAVSPGYSNPMHELRAKYVAIIEQLIKEYDKVWEVKVPEDSKTTEMTEKRKMAESYFSVYLDALLRVEEQFIEEKKSYYEGEMELIVDLSISSTLEDIKRVETVCLDSSYGMFEVEEKDLQSPTSCPDSNHPHKLDLDLPSGTLWACCNVGAASPEEYGGYYAWGETQVKNNYILETYAYWKDGELVNIGSDIAGTRYDAATVNWGNPWFMPARVHVDELKKYSNSCLATLNGVKGVMYKSKRNGIIVFIPIAGCRWETEINYVGDIYYYWLSELLVNDNSWATFMSNLSGGRDGTNLYEGYSVRPVCK